jgi:hypothetical protein
MYRAERKHKDLVIDILVSAFEPLTYASSLNRVVKQDSKRKKRMTILMAYLFEKAMKFGEVHISDNDKACLIFSYSDKEKFSLKIILLEIQLAFKCMGIKNVINVAKRKKVMQKYFPKEPHYRPLIFGAKPEYQGVAARFMFDIDKYYMQNPLPVVGDVAAEINVKLYEKFGFRVIAVDETLGFPLWIVRRN